MKWIPQSQSSYIYIHILVIYLNDNLNQSNCKYEITLRLLQLTNVKDWQLNRKIKHILLVISFFQQNQFLLVQNKSKKKFNESIVFPSWLK